MIVHGVCLLPASLKRRVGSVDIPKLTEEEVRKRFDYEGEITDPKNKWMLPLVAEVVDPMMVVYNDKRYVAAHMNSCIRIYHGQPAGVTWWDFLAMQTAEYNGQLKNFMVAVRTWPAAEVKSLRVLVKGSRAMMGGGRWHEFYAGYLARFVHKGVIDLYDPNEVTESFTTTYGDNTIVSNRYASAFLGDGKEYDVCIDDAYLAARGTVDWKPASKFYSIKDHTWSAQPFLHATEGRRFSQSPLVFDKVKGCPCKVCTIISESCASQLGQDYLREVTAILGRKGCKDFQHGDLRALADVTSRLASFTKLETPGELRGAIALTSSVPLIGDGLTVMAGVYSNKLSKSDYVKDKGFCKRKRPFIESRRPATYVGIDPYAFPIKASKGGATGSMSGGGGLYVVSNWDQAPPGADEVWIPNALAKKRFMPSGRKAGQFFHYTRPILFTPMETAVVASKIACTPLADVRNLTGVVQSDSLVQGVKNASSLTSGMYVKCAGVVVDDTKIKIVGPDQLKQDQGYVLTPQDVLVEANVGFRESTLSFVVPARQSYKTGVMYVSSKDLGTVATWSCVEIEECYVYFAGPHAFAEFMRRAPPFIMAPR